MVLYFVAASLFSSVGLLNENGLATVVGLCYLCRVGIMIFWFSNCLHICWDLQVSWFKVCLIYVDADLLSISIIVINDVIYWFYICITLFVWCWIVWLIEVILLISFYPKGCWFVNQSVLAAGSFVVLRSENSHKIFFTIWFHGCTWICWIVYIRCVIAIVYSKSLLLYFYYMHTLLGWLYGLTPIKRASRIVLIEVLVLILSTP